MKFYLVDTFASDTFTGAQAAVCFLNKQHDEALLPLISDELNALETIFLTPNEKNQNHYFAKLYYKREIVRGVGHSILAAAHIIWQQQNLGVDESIYFETNNDIYKVRYSNTKGYTIDLGLRPEEEQSLPDRLVNAVGHNPISVRQNKKDFIVELKHEKDLADAAPDIAKLAAIDSHKIILTSESSFVENLVLIRVFCPKQQSEEESVSIDTYPFVASFWAKRLAKNHLLVRQLSARTTNISAEIHDENVALAGNCTTVAEGVLRLTNA